MNPEAYIELSLELVVLKGELQKSLDEIAGIKENYFNWIARMQQHNEICPIGGLP